MLARIQNAVWKFLRPPNDNGVVQTGKRNREDSEDTESGELAKRLCKMTESRMSARRAAATEEVHLSSATNFDNEVQQVWPAPEPVGARSGGAAASRRLCLPRRPSRSGQPSLSAVPATAADAAVKDANTRPVLVERNVPILVEREMRPDKPCLTVTADSAREPRSMASRRHRWAEHSKQVNSAAADRAVAADTALASVELKPPAAAAAAADATDDVLVIGQTKSHTHISQKGGSDFLGLRSFRQMLEKKRVAGRSSPFKRSRQKSGPAKSYRNMFDKLMGITPNQLLTSRRGLSTYNCFRLDEKRRYQMMLSQMNGSGQSPSMLDVSTSFRTKSLLASPTRAAPTAALRQDQLSAAAASSLMRRISLVDLTSTENDRSQQQQQQEKAADGAASAQTEDASDDVIIERVVASPSRVVTQLEQDMTKHLQHLSEIRHKYALAERDRQLQIREEEKRRDISACNDAEWQRGLTQRMRRQMRVTQRVALEADEELSSSEEEEEEEEEPVLPELTQEMEAKISAALRPSPPNELIADAFNQRITRHDLQTLKGLNWLNDEVINFYMNLLMDRSKKNEQLPKLYCFNTFFYGKIVSQGHQSVKRWTKKVDVFAQDLLMIPVHLGMHWCLACVDLRDQTVRYLDSMGGDNDRGLNAILKYLRDEHVDKKKSRLDTSGWQSVNEKEIPQQMNGSDCGMFCCKFAEYLSRDARITFSQEHMPYFRRRMVYEIITKKLLQ